MLAYFPAPYPNELLYSVLARYCRHVGSPATKQALLALFGNGRVVASFDLPGHLGALAERIPAKCGLSVDRMIDELTLYPYFTAFEPSSIQFLARRAIRDGAVEGLYLQLGLAAFRTGRIGALRFCAKCQIEMYDNYGETYWRRDHQLASALVCPDHGCLLQESSVSFLQRSRHAFIVADPGNCPRHARPVVPVVDNDVLTHLHRLVRLSSEVLHGSSKPRTFEGWTRYYRSRMLEVGFVRSVCQVDQHRLAAEFREFYGRTLDLLPGVMYRGQFTGGWLEAMVRKHRKANHPLHHLLLQDFLAQQETHKSPFGTGPWACRNPLADHSSPLIIEKVEVHRNRGNSVGVFACTCGYTYTRCFSPSQQKLGPPRFLRYGSLLESELRRLVAGGIGLRETARQLKLDPKTVMRLVHELNVSVSWTLKPSGYGRKRPKEEAPSRRKQEKLDSGPKCGKVKSARHDWPLIDQSFVRRLLTLVKDIKAENPPVRVTLAELERRNGRRGWLLKRRRQLPLTSRRLDRVVESVEQFQLRRIYWAIAEIKLSGGPTKAWKVMRMAGLRSDSLRRIEAVLSDAPYRWRAAA